MTRDHGDTVEAVLLSFSLELLTIRLEHAHLLSQPQGKVHNRFWTYNLYPRNGNKATGRFSRISPF